jgi:D-tagatose-1,6-bisphosphate aldolase subunit GatZ/KbaZ
MVVQPGVEFSDDGVHAYNRNAAHDLTECMKQKKVILEGHSTDYQTEKCLKEMVEDGIAILKVGPALTYSLREGLFALSDIETELSGFIHETSCFKEKLDNAMTQNPTYWRNYYKGNETEMHLKRKYSFSDRSRYYLACTEVKETIYKLLDNLDHCEIPLTLLSQYMPSQYKAIRNGELSPRPKMLLLDCVNHCIKKYNQAVF